jgi:hypothetical protein
VDVDETLVLGCDVDDVARAVDDREDEDDVDIVDRILVIAVEVDDDTTITELEEDWEDWEDVVDDTPLETAPTAFKLLYMDNREAPPHFGYISDLYRNVIGETLTYSNGAAMQVNEHVFPVVDSTLPALTVLPQ